MKDVVKAVNLRLLNVKVCCDNCGNTDTTLVLDFNEDGDIKWYCEECRSSGVYEVEDYVEVEPIYEEEECNCEYCNEYEYCYVEEDPAVEALRKVVDGFEVINKILKDIESALKEL